MNENQEVYIPIIVPRRGVIMNYIRADLVVRDANGTEVVGAEVIVERRDIYPEEVKVIMSLEQGIQMIGMLITQSGLTTKDVMGMVEEAHQKVYAEMATEDEAILEQNGNDGN